MDTQALQAFITVIEFGSITTAAEKLHLTQPAVSKRIASLEQQLGMPLFDRIGRSVQLNKAGLQLHPIALRIIQDVEEAKRSIQSLNEQISGPLALGISHHIGLHRLPPVLKGFAKEYPDVQLDISFMDSEDAYYGVLHGSLDIGVITLAPELQKKEKNDPLLTETIWQDPLSFVVSKQHPLSKHKKIDLNMLSQHPAILPDLHTYTGRIIEELFNREGINLTISMATNYLETIRMMVSIGLGWSVLPNTMLNDDMHSLPISKHELNRELGYVVHPKRSLSNAAKAFIATLNNEKKN